MKSVISYAKLKFIIPPLFYHVIFLLALSILTGAHKLIALIFGSGKVPNDRSQLRSNTGRGRGRGRDTNQGRGRGRSGVAASATSSDPIDDSYSEDADYNATDI